MLSLSCHLGDCIFCIHLGNFSCSMQTELCHTGSSSLTRNGTRAPAFGQQSLSQRTTFTYCIFVSVAPTINKWFLCDSKKFGLFCSLLCPQHLEWHLAHSKLLFKKKKNLKKIYLFIFGCAGSSLLLLVVQSLSRVLLFETAWTAALQASLSFTISQNLLRLMSIEMMMPSNRLILCRTLLLLPSIFPSIRVFSNELALCIRCQTSASASVLPMNIQTDFL